MKTFLALILPFIFILISSCEDPKEKTLALHSEMTVEPIAGKSRTLSEEFKKYWYAGTAEITSYRLTQERYGELREGTSVNIFVTEDFLPGVQVKADRSSEKNIPVLKLNQTKKYLTGIYPYSVMTSTFSPVKTRDHAIKISHSMQEWCGHVYVQLNNKKQFDIESHSYFEGEADFKTSLTKTWTENELWNLIRINPDELPTGDITVLPSFEFSRMSHKGINTYLATGNVVKGNSVSTYTLSYPNANRELVIHFNNEFPFAIEGWEEKHPNGLTSTAKKIKRIQTAYWGQNSNKDLFLRDSLGI
ncbi:MAG: septum formation inhibitor Maf [Bacteroidetes bacterium]|nr:septum formation inhibitor Maf [Bacteroidota bacterium]